MGGGRMCGPRGQRETTWVSRAMVMTQDASLSAITSGVNIEMFEAEG